MIRMNFCNGDEYQVDFYALKCEFSIEPEELRAVLAGNDMVRSFVAYCNMALQTQQS